MAQTFLIEYASGESSATTGKTFPVDGGGNRTIASWIQCIGAGTVVAVCEGGSGTVFTKHAIGGEVYKGSFTSLTSTSCQYVVMGNGAAPPAIPQGATSLNGTSVPAGGSLTTGNVLQVSGAGATTYAPVNLAGGANYVTNSLPATNQQRYATAATQTASWTVAVDTLYILNTTNTAAVATLPLIDATNDGHDAAMFNAGTTAAVWTPASGDAVGGTAASNATLAGPAAGLMKTLVANLATRRWIPLA